MILAIDNCQRRPSVLAVHISQCKMHYITNNMDGILVNGSEHAKPKGLKYYSKDFATLKASSLEPIKVYVP